MTLEIIAPRVSAYIASERERAFRSGWQAALEAARGGMPGSRTQQEAWLVYRSELLREAQERSADL